MGMCTKESGRMTSGMEKVAAGESVGTLTSPNGDKYEGLWRDDKKFDGVAQKYDNGDMYNGEIQDGERNGRGKSG